ncbi:MAG: MlaD family protein [Planctomycetota bacterium]
MNRSYTLFHLLSSLLITTLSLFFLTWVTLKIRNYTLSGEKLLPAQGVEVYLEKAGGLTGAKPVRYQGMEVGHVLYVQLVTKPGKYQNWAYAYLELNQKVPLYKDASVKVSPSSLMGNPYIELFPGKETSQPLQQPIYEEGAITPLFEALSQLMDENREDFKALFDGFQKITKKLNDTRGTLQKLFEAEDSLTTDIKKIGDDLSHYLEKTNQGSARFFSQESQELRNEIKTLKQQIEQIQKAVEETKKSSLVAILDEPFRENADNTFQKFSEFQEEFSRLTTHINEGKGLIPQLYAKESPLATALRETWESAKKIGDHFQKLGEQISNGKGGLWSASGGSEIRKTYEQIAQDLNAISQKIEAGGGSLARLYEDKTLRDKTVRCLRQLSEIGEDKFLELPVHALLSQMMQNLIP